MGVKKFFQPPPHILRVEWPFCAVNITFISYLESHGFLSNSDLTLIN